MRLCCRLLLLVWALACGFPSISLCQEEERTPQQQWDQAKKTFQKELNALRKGIIDQVTALEDKARDRGDADKVKKYKNEREAFEEDGELPSSASGQYEYRTKLRAAKRQLRQTFKEVQTAYLKAKKDADAEELEREFEELTADFAIRSDGISEDTPAGTKPEGMPATNARWLNTSYDNTLVHVRGTQWIEKDNKTGKTTWHFTEISRNRQYIELKRREVEPNRLLNYRVYANRMDVKKADKWEWVSNGHWVASK